MDIEGVIEYIEEIAGLVMTERCCGKDDSAASMQSMNDAIATIKALQEENADLLLSLSELSEVRVELYEKNEILNRRIKCANDLLISSKDRVKELEAVMKEASEICCSVHPEDHVDVKIMLDKALANKQEGS